MSTDTRPVAVFAGLCTLDVVSLVERAPSPNEKVTAEAQLVSAGGPATNAAVTFAALGGDALLVTAVGDNPVAELVRRDLAACGVSLVDVLGGGSWQPSISAITVVAGSGERSVVSLDAAGIELPDVPDLTSLCGSAGAVLVDGHHPRLASEAARAARAAGTPVVVDAGRWRPVMADLLPAADAVICSADFRPPDGSDPIAALVARGVRTVVITHGAGPVEWVADGLAGSVAPPSVRAVDTAGAGDVFHGAYCFAALQWPTQALADHLRFAASVAALKCQSLGTRHWVSQLAERAPA